MNAPAGKSDLATRTASAVVMVAMAGGALWVGGAVWIAFVTIIGAGVWWEWSKLTRGIAASKSALIIWWLAGMAYVGGASIILGRLRQEGAFDVILIVGAVIATDVGAYFAGRAIGGPKIAPRISPSKTWAGLLGGIAMTSLFLLAIETTGHAIHTLSARVGWTIVFGAAAAITAQTGDFFESWMKRRAGVKDSGNLVPGHGGLFDRVDGLLAVLFVLGVIELAARVFPKL